LAGIERIVLSESRRDGDNLLRHQGGGVAWTSDGFLVRVFPEGGVSSTKLDNMGRTHQLLMTGRDAAGEIQLGNVIFRNADTDLRFS